MLRSSAISLLILSLVACGGSSPSGEAPSAGEAAPPPSSKSETWFEVTGDVQLRIEPAMASIFTNRADIVTLNVVSGRGSIREHGRSYSANLFFSKDFDPKPGTYPIKFDYLSGSNTLGGSFVGKGMYSHDTEGEAEFTEFGDKVRVRYRFTTFSTSQGSGERQAVTVTGEAVSDRGDAF